MDQILLSLVTSVVGGGPHAIAAILLGIIVLLLFDRSRLLKLIDKKDDAISQIIKDYSTGSITIAQALESLKMALYEIKAKI